MTNEMKEKISLSLTGKKMAPYSRSYKQVWITDGKTNTRIKDGEVIPNGFRRGRSTAP